jgi:16S rRNA (cytosine967-C5)-methyltransferase
MAPLNVLNAQNPRQIAARVLGRRKPGGEFVEDLLENAFASSSFSSSSSKPGMENLRTRMMDEDEIRLSAKDRALCQEIVYGVVRWQAALDWLILRKTNGREQKPALQNLLRVGLYQIFWLDRIPDHAAVHETVELAKQNGFGPQAGFVNAILRGYLREADETRKLLADLKISRPALGWSQPEWLVTRWQARWGAEKTGQLLAWNNTPPKTFARVNTLKTDATKLIEKWREENVDYDFIRGGGRQTSAFLAGTESSGFPPKTAAFENLVFELKSHPPLNSLASFRDGWFYIQDPSTLLAVCELDPQPGETILDLCAAPGGKTTFIAQLLNNEGKIVANDISEERLKLVQENCTRLGVACVEFCRSRGDEAQFEKSEISQRLLTSSPTIFDRVLVDAPCSNTGVMRRRVDLRWRISPEEILRLKKTQLDLLKLAATKLKPGGILIYSTCSLEPEENSEVVREFLRAHENFKLESERELLPFADHVDGAFAAKLLAQKS